jgi:two-component system alkaline phosphatase synthesis response regulator PhoP
MQSKSATPGRKKIRVLVATNDEESLKIIEPRLGSAFETVETRDGVGAVETATRYKPDLIIIDAILPRMNGEQAIGMIRKNEEFFQTPVIFLSDRGYVRDGQHAEQIGATLCLVKPFSAGELMEGIDRIVSNPGFKIRTDRIGISQAHLEQFQRREIHRSGPMPTVEQLERQHLENILKQQLK